MKKQKIFIVEDDKFYATILEKTLRNIDDFEIEKYYSGGACMTQFHTQPDIIFLDYQLGDTNGFEILKEIKSTYPDIQIVMLSGQTNLKIVVKSLKYGALDYLLKDIDDHEGKLRKIIGDIQRINEIKNSSKSGKGSRIMNFFTF